MENKETEIVESTIENTPTDGGKTYTEVELRAEAEKLAKELTNNAVRDRINKIKSDSEAEKQKAIEDAIKKTQMSESEKLALELEELRTENTEWKEKYNRKEKSEEIVKKLTSAKITVDDDIIDTLINSYDKADSIIEKLSLNIKSAVDREVEEKLKSSGSSLPKQSEMSQAKSTAVFRTPASRIGAIK